MKIVIFFQKNVLHYFILYNIINSLEAFMKNKYFSSVIFSMMLAIGILLLGCDNGNGAKEYTVSIGALTNANGCTVSASPTVGTEGTEITITVTPVSGYRLKAGTLKYGSTSINESTLKFNLPAENVTIVAEFENSLLPATVGEIRITGIPESYNDQYACMRASLEIPGSPSLQLFGMANAVVEGTFIGVKIEGGSVTIPVYLINGNAVVSYVGSHTVDACIVTKVEPSFIVISDVVSGGHQIPISVTFSNGKATAGW
jgi:hypothetical protein